MEKLELGLSGPQYHPAGPILFTVSPNLLHSPKKPVCSGINQRAEGFPRGFLRVSTGFLKGFHGVSEGLGNE